MPLVSGFGDNDSFGSSTGCTLFPRACRYAATMTRAWPRTSSRSRT